MIHLGHMLLFSGLLAFFFSFLFAEKKRRVKFALSLWGVMAGAAFVLSLVMYPFS